MSYRIIPNVLTFLRIFLVLPCAYFLYLENYQVAISIFVLASATDCIDGFLARKLACQTELGAILDPLADKFLIVALFFVLTLKGFIPLWFAVIIIGREFILLSGAAFYRYKFGPVVFTPTMISKINTGLLLFLLLITLIEAMSVNTNLLINLKYYVILITLFTSIYSSLIYIIRWAAQVKQSFKKLNN